MRILIVEGNTADIIVKRKDIGRETAAELYQDTLSCIDPDAHLDTAIPYAPQLEDHEIDLCSYDAFALTGSGVNWSSCEPEAKPYLEYLERIFDCRKPVIGSCWGMQTVAQLFGGHSEPNDAGIEIGLARNLELSAEGKMHPVYEGMPGIHDSICIHRDHVTRMPEGFVVLASNEASPVQAMASTRPDVDFIGFQYHPEYTWSFIKWQAEFLGYDLLEPSDNHVHLPENPPQEVLDATLRTRAIANWIGHVHNKKAADKEAAA